MKRKTLCRLCAAALCLVIGCSLMAACGAPSADDFAQPKFSSANLIGDGCSVTDESLVGREKADGANILAKDGKSWTPTRPDGSEALNSYVEIDLGGAKTFNTAVIRETGNEVQYFRLFARVDGQWQVVYQSEKIQNLRLMSFDAVTADAIRLSIDKFRGKSAKIESIELYNEPKRAADDFNVTVYQRLDGDVRFWKVVQCLFFRQWEHLRSEASTAGVRIMGTGRSDFPNQINNVLAFPGIFRGALDVRASDINDEMKIAAAEAIAGVIPENEITPEYIIPDSFDPRVKDAVAEAVKAAARRTGVARI